ncbi:MAG TPA: hypothetical protein VJ487_09080 [Alphaproteobacteria bacterium]|nr:hypothetical protein [Alphaproteobacteria bacterium]
MGGSIADCRLATLLLECHQPRALVNLADATALDRSIDGPAPRFSHGDELKRLGLGARKQAAPE